MGKIIHGAASGGIVTPEYVSWHHMKARVLNPKTHSYPDYGGRGIKVCKRWLNSFAAFIADMGLKPTPQHTLDRRNNNGDYKPSNCRWATRAEQSRNKRKFKSLEKFSDRELLTEVKRRGLSLD